MTASDSRFQPPALRGRKLGVCVACGQPVFLEQSFTRYKGRVRHVRCPTRAHARGHDVVAASPGITSATVARTTVVDTTNPAQIETHDRRASGEDRRTANERSGSARQRDVEGRQRDLVAEARDRAADVRDQQAQARDALSDKLRDTPTPNGGYDVTVCAELDRQLETADRVYYAEQRALAAQDRAQAAHDRRLSARDRAIAVAEQRLLGPVDPTRC